MEFSDLKVPGEVHRVMHYSENLSIKYHDQNFYIKTAFLGKYWTGQTIDECEKVSFWGNLIKISISVLRFSTESAENQQFKTCYSSLQYILLKMTINLPLKGNISTRAVTLFWDRFKMLTYHQVSRKLLFPYKLSNKKSKSVKHRVIGSFFRRHQLIKDRGAQICTPPIWIGLKWVRQQLRTHVCDVSSFFCNYYCSKWYQKHRIYVIDWLKKLNLELLLFE